MSAEVAEAIRQTRRTLAEKTWVPWFPDEDAGECCLVSAMPAEPTTGINVIYEVIAQAIESEAPDERNDRQTDVGAVLGMTLQALIAELCKPTSPLHREGVTSSPEKKGPRGL